MKKIKKLLCFILSLMILSSTVSVGVFAVDCMHRYTIRIAKKAATCTEDGNIAYKICEENDCILDLQNRVIDINDVIIPALGHSEEIVPGYTATCTADGLTDGKKCTACGEITAVQEIIPSSGHNEITETNTVENPTCATDGKNVVVTYCDVCNEKLNEKTVTVPATGEHKHTLEVEGSKVLSTCTTQGSVNMKCVCGDTITVAVDVDENAHSWGEWTVTKTPTCTLDGEEYRVCAHDNSHTERRALPPESTAHTLTSRIENGASASCGADGYYTVVVYCSVCGETTDRQIVTVPATGNHNYITEISDTKVPSTCVKEGSVQMQCTCGAVRTVSLPIDTGNHKWSEKGVVTKNPTCVSVGEIVYQCSNNGCAEIDKRTLGVDAAAHKWDNGTVTKAATCSSEGIIEYCCAYSSLHMRTEKIPVDTNAHNPLTETQNYVAATCGKNGSYDTVTFCTDCKVVLKTVVNTIPATGEHNYTEEVSGTKVPPTCISDGSVTLSCICGAEKIKKLPKDVNAHIPDSEGYDCILCGKELRCRHNWTAEKVVTRESSCVENGSKAIICTKCNEAKSGSVETIPAFGHNFVDEWKTVSTPTCQTEGIKIRICRTCFDFQTETVKKLNHSDKDKNNVCDNCNAVIDMSVFFPDDTEKTEDATSKCDCDCHKTGFTKVMFSIINFFQKLFGSNKTCKCGVKH